MNKNIIISNPEKLEKIKKIFLRDGMDNLHVLADFDKTLTRAFVNGKCIVSFISILRDENYLTPDYAQKAQALYDKYRPIEIDPNISCEEKNKLMHEWWMAHFGLLIKSGLNKKDIRRAAESGKVRLREGFQEFIEILNSNNIPLVILSASGMGTEAISICLEKAGKLGDNIFIASNSFEWDKDGNAVGVRQPIIHSVNKSLVAAKNFSFYKEVKDRKNILLLGDSIEDAEMAQDFDYSNVIKIGFLNEIIGNNIDLYKKAYDILILNDGPMEYINKLLIELNKK